MIITVCPRLSLALCHPRTGKDVTASQKHSLSSGSKVDSCVILLKLSTMFLLLASPTVSMRSGIHIHRLSLLALFQPDTRLQSSRAELGHIAYHTVKPSVAHAKIGSQFYVWKATLLGSAKRKFGMTCTNISRRTQAFRYLNRSDAIRHAESSTFVFSHQSSPSPILLYVGFVSCIAEQLDARPTNDTDLSRLCLVPRGFEQPGAY